MCKGLIILALFPIAFWYVGETLLTVYGLVLFSLSFGTNLGRVTWRQPVVTPEVKRYQPLQWR